MIVHVVSLPLKPLPEIVTVAPGDTKLGLRVITGVLDVTASVTVASPLSAPFVFAVIRYEPGATLATRNEAVRIPPEIEQLDEAIEPLPVSEHDVSVV